MGAGEKMNRLISGSPVPVIDTWGFFPREEACTAVLPDGCRDLILRISPDGRPHWFVSELADSVSLVSSRAGERFLGYRFHPAAMFREESLVQAVGVLGEADPADIERLIVEHVRIDERLEEALDSLSDCDGVAAASRRLGVSERSLERLVRGTTGRSPGFWKSLARARRAAGALRGGLSLPEIAADHGYADQAHMTRDFGKWFGMTPGQFRASPIQLALVREPGYR